MLSYHWQRMAQMLNFPIAGGTSGHLVGAALAAILLGPWVGALIMSYVLIVQCLIFQDGGLLSLNLDPRAKWSFIELLGGLPMTKIIASHDLEMVQALCERTIILDKGRIVADDLTQRILTDIALLRANGLAPDSHGGSL